MAAQKHTVLPAIHAHLALGLRGEEGRGEGRGGKRGGGVGGGGGRGEGGEGGARTKSRSSNRALASFNALC